MHSEKEKAVPNPESSYQASMSVPPTAVSVSGHLLWRIKLYPKMPERRALPQRFHASQWYKHTFCLLQGVLTRVRIVKAIVFSSGHVQM